MYIAIEETKIDADDGRCGCMGFQLPRRVSPVWKAMPSYRLAAVAVFILLALSLGPGCTEVQTHPVGRLWRPIEYKVGDVGRASGLPLTASVALTSQVTTGPITATIKIINVTDHRKAYPGFDYVDPEKSFAMWVMHKGREMLQTDHGKKILPRYTESIGGICGGPSITLEPGGSKVMTVDLAKLFQFPEPGEYTLLIEKAPVADDDNCREFEAAQASFNLLP